MVRRTKNRVLGVWEGSVCIYIYAICVYIYICMYICMCIYIYVYIVGQYTPSTAYCMSNRQIYCTNLVLLCLGVAEGCAKPSLPIGDDPTLCMALKWTSNFVHYSYIIIYTHTYKYIYIYIYTWYSSSPLKPPYFNDLKWISQLAMFDCWRLFPVPHPSEGAKAFSRGFLHRLDVPTSGGMWRRWGWGWKDMVCSLRP